MATIALRDKMTDKLISEHPAEAGQILDSWLSDNIDDYEVRASPPISITINEQVVFQKHWPDRVISDSDNIVIYPEPKAVALPFILKTLAYVALNYAVNYYTAKQANNSAKTVPDGSSIYSANGQGNSRRLNGIIPELFGRHKYYPDVVSQPWREFIDNEEWLYLTLCAGVGVYTFEKYTIGETPVDRYLGDIYLNTYGPAEDLTGDEATRNVYTSLEVDSLELVGGSYSETEVYTPGDLRYTFRKIAYFDGEPDARIFAEQPDGLGGWEDYVWPFVAGDLIKIESTPSNYGNFKIKEISGNLIYVTNVEGWGVGFEDTVNVSAEISGIESVDIGEYFGPFLACPASSTTTQSTIDLLYLGLGRFNDDGDLISRTVDVDIEWREVGTDDWTVINVSKTATTRDELGDTITIPHGAGIVPEVRMRRMSREVDDVQVFDEVRWVRLKSELPGVIDNADVTIITAKIRGTNALSSAAQSQFSTIQVRHLETYEDGEWLPAAATTDIAPVVAYAIKDSGHPDERIALDELEELDGVWKARGDEFNAVFDEDGTLYESLKKVLAVGFAQPVINTGRILPIREAAESYDGLMFSTDNTTSITEEGTLFDPDENDGVTVEYFSNETWLPEYIDCLLPGDAGVNTEAVRAIGITDKTKAYQFGMRYRRSQYYSRVSYTIETEQESKNGNLLEKCRVPSRDTQNGWCEAYDAGLQVLTVNTGLVWTDDEQHYIGVRRPDGSLSGSYACSKVDEFNVLLDEPLAFTPQFDGPLENPLFMFGIADSWSKPARIRSIEPKADGKSTVIASTYDERVFLDDDSVPD